MLIPLNNHLLISPLKHEDFVEGQNSFDEKGEVLAVAGEVPFSQVKVGDIVYFDSYLCAKYPSKDPEKPFWLVDFKDVRAKE